MYDLIIGIDNGSTGSIGILEKDTYFFCKTPVKKERSYTKVKQNITRIHYPNLYDLLQKKIGTKKAIALIERPMVNPTRFKATISALRCLEATLICCEQLQIDVVYVDSKQWQKEMFKTINNDELSTKEKSLYVGKQLFPLYENLIEKHKDADSLLMAYWYSTKVLKK